MDTLAYVHLAAIYETSAFPDSEAAADSSLSFQELDWTICRSGAWIPLVFFVIALSSLGLSSPALALQKGNSSSQVTSLQKKLSASGYFRGPITGYYGSLTQSAVSQFQKANGLIANGIADEVTLKALDSSSGTPVTPATPAPSQPAALQPVVTDDPKVMARRAVALQKGNRSSQVTSLQKKLQAAGYFEGPITGYYGSLTQAAVSKFQKAKGLIANGIADEVTLKALDSSSGASTSSQSAAPQSVVSDDFKVDNPGN